MHCKWEHDEICTNDKSPVCADYCRGFDAPGRCRFEEPFTDLEYIRAKLGDAELLAQIAEECSELAHASLKLRRVLDGTNPTPVTEEEAVAAFSEEYLDLILCLRIFLESDETPDELTAKLRRWCERLKAKEAGA